MDLSVLWQGLTLAWSLPCSLSDLQALGILLSLPSLELQLSHYAWYSLCGCWELNLNPNTCEASTSLTELSLSLPL